jgi:catechol 2,3-dioxygenase-like lactoylglutathione lyase family enzyme
MLKEIGHIALIVQNPARTASLLAELFESKIVSRKDSDGHEETFVRLGRTWFALVKADVQRPRTGDHVAFSVSKSTLLACAKKLKQMGQEFSFARSDTALYFYDYDNHLFELDTTDLEKDLGNEV